MYEASGSKGDDEQEKFLTLMNEALEQLDKALKLDETYWPASINKSLVLLGLEKYGSCEDELNSKAILALLKNNKDMNATISEIRAIMNYSKGDTVKGKSLFITAHKAGSSSARMNEMILTDRIDQHAGPTISQGIDTAEKWNNKMVYKGLKSYRTSTDHVTSYANGKADLLLDSAVGYKIFELRQKIGFCPVQYVKVAVNYQEGVSTSKGLKNGSSVAELTKKYGVPQNKVPGTVFAYWIYPGQNLIVMVDNASAKVNGWLYFMMD
jgi:hypothetical protein